MYGIIEFFPISGTDNFFFRVKIISEIMQEKARIIFTSLKNPPFSNRIQSPCSCKNSNTNHQENEISKRK